MQMSCSGIAKQEVFRRSEITAFILAIIKWSALSFTMLTSKLTGINSTVAIVCKKTQNVSSQQQISDLLFLENNQNKTRKWIPMSLQRSWSASLLKIVSFQSACLLFEAESKNYSIIPRRATIAVTLNSSNAPAEFPFIPNTEIQSRRPLHVSQHKEDAVFM